MRLSKKYSDLTGNGLFLIAGPCVIENEKMAYETAEKLIKITGRLGIPFVFKASYDKANRSSIGSYRGPGIKKGLALMAKIRKKLNVPVVTDVHETKDVIETAKAVDILQIPAFLCRQTDLVVAAAKTGKIVNIKKGQFLSPQEMVNIIAKATSTGNKEIMLTERGFSFGYNNLVVDLKSIAFMKSTGFPVIIDATHAVQKPGGAGNRSGGEREYIEPIARGAVAAGAQGVFMEIHPNPAKAKSDKDSQYALDKVEPVLRKLKQIYDLVNG